MGAAAAWGDADACVPVRGLIAAAAGGNTSDHRRPRSETRLLAGEDLLEQHARDRVVSLRLALQRRQQAAGELLAQFDAELVEGVDAPGHRLQVDAVLVQRD